jgi:retron-type reverse transcriptase
MIGYESHKLFGDDAAQLPPSHHYHRRRRRRQQEKAKEQFALRPRTLPTLAFIANKDYLLWVFEQMKRRGGQAPGLDGLRYQDLSRSEIAAAFRDQVAPAIRNGTYRPYPYKQIDIPKGNGETRPLRLRIIIDRVVAGAIYRALVPYFEPRFLPCSYGFRAAAKNWTARGAKQETYNTWRLLADLQVVATEEKRFVLVIDDVRKAFDNVNITVVMGILAKHIKEAALLRLLEVVLRGGDDTHDNGIDQGSPLSPMILNILLDEIHDQALAKEVTNPQHLRYADNLTYPVKTIEEGNQTMEWVRDSLDKAGLTLKGRKDGSPVIDLKEEPQGLRAQLLGFSVFVKNETIHYGLGTKAWDKLNDGFREAHRSENPTATANQVAVGWVQAHGPTLDSLNKAETLEHVLQRAAEVGFHEGIDLAVLEKAWNSARTRWAMVRKEARQRYEANANKANSVPPLDDAASSAAATPPGAAPDAGGPSPQADTWKGGLSPVPTLMPDESAWPGICTNNTCVNLTTPRNPGGTATNLPCGAQCAPHAHARATHGLSLAATACAAHAWLVGKVGQRHGQRWLSHPRSRTLAAARPSSRGTPRPRGPPGRHWSRFSNQGPGRRRRPRCAWPCGDSPDPCPARTSVTGHVDGPRSPVVCGSAGGLRPHRPARFNGSPLFFALHRRLACGPERRCPSGGGPSHLTGDCNEYR